MGQKSSQNEGKKESVTGLQIGHENDLNQPYTSNITMVHMTYDKNNEAARYFTLPIMWVKKISK